MTMDVMIRLGHSYCSTVLFNAFRQKRLQTDRVKDAMLRPYWYRTWVVQEILLARQIAVMFGGQELDFRIFIDGVKSMRMRVRHTHDLPEIAPLGASRPEVLDSMRALAPNGSKLDKGVSVWNMILKHWVTESANSYDRTLSLLRTHLDSKVKYGQRALGLFWKAETHFGSL